MNTNTMRVGSLASLAPALAMIAACSQQFTETITFDRQELTKATSWTRGELSGIVYVPPGQTLPTAALQVGAIVSNEHHTAKDLHEWVRAQAIRSGGPGYYGSGAADEYCTVGVDFNAKRTYMALQVCKTGVQRAVCVEADENLNESAFTSCIQGGCEDLCDARWLERREALDLLAADLLSRR